MYCDTLVMIHNLYLTSLYCNALIFRYFMTSPTDEPLLYYLIFFTRTFVNLPSLHHAYTNTNVTTSFIFHVIGVLRPGESSGLSSICMKITNTIGKYRCQILKLHI